MQKLVALEQIKGLFSKIVYAEKYDEVEETINRIGVSQFKNLRTSELFDCRNERVGLVDDFIIINYIPEIKKKSTDYVRAKQKYEKEVQLNLF